MTNMTDHIIQTFADVRRPMEVVFAHPTSHDCWPAVQDASFGSNCLTLREQGWRGARFGNWAIMESRVRYVQYSSSIFKPTTRITLTLLSSSDRL
jgi:hypothetical protein